MSDELAGLELNDDFSGRAAILTIHDVTVNQNSYYVSRVNR